MDQTSQIKVMDAGFTIFRCDDQPTPRIKFKSQVSHEWRTHEKYETKAARNRAFDSLMKMTFAISD
jgi:hypothetical protein